MDGKPVFSAILLAAGQSVRFGGGKLRALWRGRPLILWAAEAALAAPVSEVVVVWGGDPLILDLLPQDPRLRIVECKDHGLGMGASLSAGLQALDPASIATFVFLGDMPQVPVALTGALAQAVAGGAAAAAPSFNGKRGHPVLLSSSLFSALSTLRGDQGAGPVLARLGADLSLIPAPDDGCLFDIDRPEDLGIRGDLGSDRPRP